jgi:thioredoxin family protein
MKNGLKKLKAASDNLSFFVTIFGAVLLVMNTMLAQQVKRLNIAASDAEKSLELKPGKYLSDLEGIDIFGSPVKLGYREDDRKTLLLVFSPHCGACKDNMPVWQTIIRGIDKSLYRVVAASLKNEEVREYANKYNLSGVPVIADVDAKSKLDYVMAVSPQTILINSEGRAEKVWIGKLQGAEKEDVSRALNVELQ